jgi:hypothetical protein
MYKLEGYIHSIKETVQVNDKFRKRDLIISYDQEGREQVIPFQVVQDRCDVLDSYTEGQLVEVTFKLNGRLWTSPQGEEKCFSTNEAVKVTIVGAAATAAPVAGQVSDPADDDLPF